MPDFLMLCPECQQEGEKSIVYQEMGSVTAMYCQPFYDEEGRYHHHDRNVTTIQYSCSRGHKFTKQSMGECWCGWGKESDHA